MHLKFKHLQEIVQKLRAEGGCPWDREQTLKSLTKCILEEAQELTQAIESEDHPNTKEEIGDLLFTLLMMTQIATEDGHFTLEEVLESAAEKLISRHTWVFGSDKAETPEEALALWKKNKEKEKGI